VSFESTRPRRSGGSGNLPPVPTVLLGLLVTAIGIAMMLRIQGMFPTWRVHAPPWVLATTALIVLFSGMYCVYAGIQRLRPPSRADAQTEFKTAAAGLLFFAVMMTLFAILTTAAAVYSWFPEYAHAFGSSLSDRIPTYRIGFAIGALILDTIVLYWWGSALVLFVRRMLFRKS
jgi:hypothetical protein